MKGQIVTESGGSGNALLIQDLIVDSFKPNYVYTPVDAYEEAIPPVVPGYTPVGVLGHVITEATGASSSGTRYSYINVYSCFYDIDSGKVKFGVRDIGGSKAMNLKIVFKVLYVKD